MKSCSSIKPDASGKKPMCSSNLLIPKAGRQTKTPVTPVRSWSASELYNELVESDSEIDGNF